MGMTRGCWIDLFESPKFTGKMRRLFGPANYPNLLSAGNGWNIQIASLIVGPSTYARLFAHQRPDRTIAWIMPGQSVDEMASIQSHEQFDSIRLLDRPPFSHDPGYAAFLKSAEAMIENPTAARPRKKRKK
jgi:hypothetical protein